ncbi:tyrosine hydroxylase ple [Aphomia sociella]
MAVAAAQKNREMFAIKKSYSIENGYPSRRRSLVDDARFETLVVKQNKQSVLEEARARANDSGLDSEYLQDGILIGNEDNSPTVEDGTNQDETKNGQLADADIGDAAKFDEDYSLTEEEVILQNAASESPEAEQAVQQAAFLLRMRDGMGSLARILKTIDNYKGCVQHLETRPSQLAGVQFDALVKVSMSRINLLQLIRSLRQSTAFAGVNLVSENNISSKTPWFPCHASDLDNCNHLMTKYEPELDMNHPGFADKVYRERRKEIAEIAFAYKYGDPIPHITYTEVENDTWQRVFKTVLDLMEKHACSEYKAAFTKLQDAKIFLPHQIPQLEDVSNFLRKNTGFTVRPAAGLLTSRDFLASLAFRVFQSTQYVRHSTRPFHTPEPDCIHELLGHIPLLADPSFAQFSQEIGLASLGASDTEIEKLSTVYWFTVEFGLCKENQELKAYGAALLSSTSELLHAISDKPELRPFEPASTSIQPYQDQEVQPIYYVAESLEDAKDKFRRWVSTMSRPFEVRFNPHTERVEVLDSVDKLETLIGQLNTEMLHLTNAIKKLKGSHFE